MDHLPPPRAFVALDHFPALRAAVEPGLRRQSGRLAVANAHYQERPRLLAALETALRDPAGGVVLLEGPPGSGVTSLLAVLAARHGVPLWLVPEAGPAGPAALYAQLVARYRPAVPLLDPTVSTDPAALERLLGEAVTARGSELPVVLAIDELDPPGLPTRPGPTPLPAELPRGVTLVLGCVPGAPTPYTATTHLRLPDDDPDLHTAQARTLAAKGCPRAWAGPLIRAAAGNFLYLHLALALLRRGAVALHTLPQGLDALLRAWWDALGPDERRLAALLAAAGESLPLALATALTNADPRPALGRWAQLGLVELNVQPAPPDPGLTQEEAAAQRPRALYGAFTHGALAALLTRVGAPELAAAHHDLAAVALSRAAEERPAPRSRTIATHAQGTGLEAAHEGDTADPEAVASYLHRQLARHAALAPRHLRDTALPALFDRPWLRAHERHDNLEAALEAARWELRAAAVDGPELRLVRAAALAGMLATRARTLSPAAAAEALETGLAHGGREPALKRVLDNVERLPDGLEKATILRRLGEVCYGNRMRSSALRLLSRALDLEAAPVSRAWRDTREGLHAALAGAALELGAPDTALVIAERIEHLERRAMVETQVVRHLLEIGDYTQAQRLARAMLHESMSAWAQAEVGVALARAGDPRSPLLLEELTLETVVSWAQIELACDEALSDEEAALRRIAALPTQGQRDRGLARLARALATAGNDGAALAAAEQITAVEARVAALIDLRLTLEGLVAMLALERATRDIGSVIGDERGLLLAGLAAALAALGRPDRALAIADQLPAGEEHDRALARVAVALAQRGEHEPAYALLVQVDDDDERAWAYEECARLLAATGHWTEAAELCARINAADQRAAAAADLAIARARAGEPLDALTLAIAVELPGERARALTLVAPQLVAAGADEQALAVAQHPDALLGAEARGRYLAAVAGALAEHGHTEAAATVVAGIRRPADRARAGIALARALAPHTPTVARAVLGAALRAAAVGREETFRALELAAPALGQLGGAQLLAAVAAAVDAIDQW